MKKGSATHAEMLGAPLRPLICRMAVPGIINMVITAVYNMVDTFFVSRLGTSASGATGIVFSLMALILAIGLFYGHGSGNYISRELGAKRVENAEHMLAAGFFLCLATGALLSVLGLLFLDPLVRLLGATDTIFPHAKAYTRYILIGAPFMAGSLTLNNQLRCQGNPMRGMAGMAAGAVVNIALDPLFIFVFHMGTGGAGLATLLSQMLSFFLLLLGCTRRGGQMRLRFSAFRVNGALLREVGATGFPSFARQMLAAVSTMCLNHVAGLYGDAAIAAMAIVARTMNFVNSTVLGFGQGFQPVCGFNYGAGRYGRVWEGFRFCVRVTSGFLLAACACGFIFATPVIGLFRDDPAVIEIGARALRYQCVVFPVMGFVVVANMLFQNIGYAGKASVLALARQGIFFLPLLYALAYGFGLTGLLLAQPLSDALTFLIALPMSAGVLRALKGRSGDGKDGTDEKQA